MMHFMIALSSLVALSATLAFIVLMLHQNVDKIITALELGHQDLSPRGVMEAGARRTVPNKQVMISGALSVPAGR